jgi:ABC-type Fe3+ transport system permease subunit
MQEKHGAATIVTTDIARKYVGIALGFIPFCAAICDWIVIGMWQELWRDTHRRVTRFAPKRNLGNSLKLALCVTVVCLALHLITYLMRRILSRRGGFLDMGKTAWRVLFAGCHLAGFILGIWIYLASLRGS